jgi:hypothetical protein
MMRSLVIAAALYSNAVQAMSLNEVDYLELTGGTPKQTVAIANARNFLRSCIRESEIEATPGSVVRVGFTVKAGATWASDIFVHGHARAPRCVSFSVRTIEFPETHVDSHHELLIHVAPPIREDARVLVYPEAPEDNRFKTTAKFGGNQIYAGIGIHAADVEAVLRAKRIAINDCRNLIPAGIREVSLGLWISSQGRVASAAAYFDIDDVHPFQTCLEDTSLHWRFPSTSTGGLANVVILLRVPGQSRRERHDNRCYQHIHHSVLQ